jgi:hypothetical protein
MSDPNFQYDERLEAYLDGLLEGPERADVEQSHGPGGELAQNMELQDRIDSRLAHMFRVEAPASGTLAARLIRETRPRAIEAKPNRRLAWAAAALAAAAAVGWLIAGMPLPRGHVDQPMFAARPLADVYRETVKDGFEPYYECREADRFADTFARRQGVALKLLPMAEGSRMLGLSYPGGLSRDTTAMLCRVDGKPVMVFVDRASADQPNAMDHAGEQAHVFRQERDGLVFYEVTPFDRPRVTEALVPAAG